jgi:glycosyltransferase involved in cell wall biosynthesis
MPMHSITKPLHDVVWEHLIFNHASRYIATTETERQQYLDEGAKRDRISVCPVGIDLWEFTNLPERQPSDKKKVLFLGRLHEIKGLDLLIEAFSLVTEKNVILQIAGNDDGYEETAKELAKDIHSIEFLGPVYGRDKLQLFANADLFVVPSRYESWGITFLEALACGTPVLMADTCAASSQLPIPCGKVSHRNSSDFAYAMDGMLRDSRYSPDFELGIKSRKLWASQFDWAIIAERIIGIYKEVLYV